MGGASSTSIRIKMAEQVSITLQSGMKRSVPKGMKLQELADEQAVAAQVNGVLVDLSQPV